MKLILVRHVETVANSENRIYGWTESVYTEKGKEQITEIIKLLKHEKIDTIYSSPLKRALHIGETLGKEFDREVHIVEDLKEMNFGIFEGKTYNEALKKYKTEWNMWVKDYKNYIIPNGENLQMVHSRVTNFIDKIKNTDSNILIVSHGGVIHSIITHLLDLEIDDRWHFKLLPGTIVEIDYDYYYNYGTIKKLISTY